MQGGLDIDLDRIDQEAGLEPPDLLFSESNGRIVFEVEKADIGEVYERFSGTSFSILCQASHEHGSHRNLIFRAGTDVWLNESIGELKRIWKDGLTRYC
jgi:phosphoribosylformylglycinamidine (FGAM) synthase-like enzyme